ncbi:hypothetical protein JHK82_052835 [Glycine max]|nr:hypothetical protein JHK86_052690 [Glycine max]KAG4927057.1 hypothetical protein JHK85_053543 [Glycine max]KAG5082681.1 hypothetical protein JHK84_052719 [Glycine max]KAG5085438.1 hypothetical protein JHK82_052835 [Glycine max]
MPPVPISPIKVGHIPDVQESIENLSREFFMLPLEEKQKYPMAPGTVQGYGEAFVLLEDEKLDRCNMFALGIEPEYVTNPNLWPNKPEKFRSGSNSNNAALKSVCAWFNSNNAAPAGSLDNTVENDFQNHHSQNKVTGLDSHKASEGALDG